jgi:hypothetical protein
MQVNAGQCRSMQVRDADHMRQCRTVIYITVKMNRWPILATRI